MYKYRSLLSVRGWGLVHLGLLFFFLNQTQVPQITAGGSSTFIVKKDGTLWSWGNNDSGQLGDGTKVDKNTPVQIEQPQADWKHALVRAGGLSVLAVKKDGSLWAWGDNDSGQLGDGTNVDKTHPVQIGTDTDWKYVDAGGAHSLAIKTDGSLWAWGKNDFGQLGDGANVDQNRPVQIGTDIDWLEVAAGGSHSLAMKTDGSLWAWGNNHSGQLGDGTSADQISPVQIETATDWKQIAAGGLHNLAVKTDGTLWAWGSNFSGQLGDGTLNDQNSPVQIGTDTDWKDIEAGGLDILSHSLAVKENNSLWGWGNNDSGQLGDGKNLDINRPIQAIETD
ncbi:MAG: hypothetical protein D3923_11265 [Candidatus Electrothrix sp. AR3]|nr:hypothetical protein [Candidatus Electrothrix sp. AR3]